MDERLPSELLSFPKTQSYKRCTAKNQDGVRFLCAMDRTIKGRDARCHTAVADKLSNCINPLPWGKQLAADQSS